MTLVDPRAVASWPFDEQADSVLPSDAAGNLDDLAVPAGLSRPAVVDGTVAGFGRDFDASALTGLMVTDSAGATALAREVTVVAMVRLDVSDLSNGDRATIVQRGRGGAVDPIGFGLRLVVVDSAAGTVRLQLFWQTEAGVDYDDVGALFTWPAGEELFLGAVREVVDGAFNVRYQVNGQSTLGDQGAALDCATETSSDVSVGCAMGAAVYLDHFDGVIDSLSLLDEAVSAEEFAWQWYAMSVAAAEGVETMRRLLPPGVYSRDPSSAVQREVQIQGEQLGLAKAVARRLRDYFLPDRAWGDYLEYWERVTKQAPKPGDDIQTRRDRILAFLGTVRGFGVEDVKAVLAPLFDLDAADVQILEHDNDYSQDFASDPGDALVIDGAASGGTPWAVAAGALSVDGGAGADLRYFGIFDERTPLYLWPLGAGLDSWVSGVVTPGATEGAAVVGMALGRRDSDEWVFIGIQQSDAVTPVSDLVWFKYKAGVLDADVTVIQVGVSLATTHLRLHVLTDGTVDVQWGVSDAAARAAVAVNINPGIAEPLWAGFCLVAPLDFDTESAEGTFDDFFSHTPQGPQRFYWQAYRDPALAGSPDMEGARLAVARMKPAHTIGTAVDALECLCDDTAGCDREPIGL